MKKDVTEKIYCWVLATRPKTLVASVIPVCISGSFFFGKNNQMPWFILCGCLLFSILVQIGCNFANDYYDYFRGSDKNRTLAPQRLLAVGKILPNSMRFSFCAVLNIALIIGIITWYLSDASFWFLLFGLSSIFFAIIYTGGPFPLAYNGLGDLFVILYFGFGAIEGTNYLLSCATGTDFTSIWSISLGTGLIINNLLVVNNYRDFDTDKSINKRTSLVKFGKKFGILLFITGFAYPAIVLPIVFNLSYLNLIILIPSLLSLFYLIKGKHKSDFDFCLIMSSISIILFATVNCIDYIS